jgi:hypothetical protein
MNTESQLATCPECACDHARTTATVNTGAWERHFFQCPECDLSFAGSWSSTHDQTTAGNTERYGHAVAPPQLAF